MRLLPGLVLLSALALPTPAAPAAPAARLTKVTTVEGITEYRLDNGLRVLIYPDQSKPFAIEESDVVAWLIAEPGVRQWLFDTIRDRGLIVYDRFSKTWSGRAIGEPPE